MDDNQLLRYSRQIMLPQVDIVGQQKLLDATVLIIGMGGLGSPVSMYLAAAGVGHLILCDDDTVDLSNLQRQIVHTTLNIGHAKVNSAQDTLQQLNPDIKITSVNQRLIGQQLLEWTAKADLIIDASDNFETRFKINAACVATETPLVSGAAIRMEGQISVFRADQANSPCYRCLYGNDGNENESCSETGVLAPVVGIIGSIQALEAIKIITGIGETLTGKVMMLDALTMEWRTLNLKKDPKCPVCSHL